MMNIHERLSVRTARGLLPARRSQPSGVFQRLFGSREVEHAEVLDDITRLGEQEIMRDTTAAAVEDHGGKLALLLETRGLRHLAWARFEQFQDAQQLLDEIDTADFEPHIRAAAREEIEKIYGLWRRQQRHREHPARGLGVVS